MLKSTAVTHWLERMWPFTMASRVEMFSLAKNRHRLFRPEMVKPWAK
jgi:hypothetical protein